MDNISNKDFDEIEPRVTPQPIPLKCITSPSVPEVSLIFGKSLDVTNTNYEDTTAEKYETYDIWKKSGLNQTAGCKVVKPKFSSNQPVNRSPSFRPSKNISLKTVSKQNTGYNDILPNETLLTNQNAILNESGQKIILKKQSSELSTRKSPGNHVNLHNYEPRIPNSSCEPTESISSNFVLESRKISKENSDLNANPDLQKQTKYSPHLNAYHVPHHTVDVNQLPPTSVEKLYQQNEINQDHNAVRDLIMLVQNQNEQIKSLQNQVDQLLESHELGNRHNIMQMSCEKPSPCYVRENSKKNIPAQHFRPYGMKIVPPYSSNEYSQVRLQHEGDQFRKTVMEQQVSIGVMTSFEFSLHKNPLPSESNHEMNVGLNKDCPTTNINESGEVWCKNLHCSRKISVEPLENINEDSESHLSSICKQSGSSPITFTPERICSKVPTNVDAVQMRRCSYDAHKSNFISEVLQPKSNTIVSSEMLFSKSDSSPAARNVEKDNTEQFPESFMQQIKNLDDIDASARTHEHNKIRLYRGTEVNKYNKTIKLDSKDQVDFEKNENVGPKNVLMDQSIRTKPSANCDEFSFVMSSSDLRLPDRLPSPDPSIHVEMREYSSDDEDEQSKRVPPIGWTFYKNVVGQVNRLLHTMPNSGNFGADEKKTPAAYKKVEKNHEILDTVKLTTRERLQMLGISYAEYSEINGEKMHKKFTFDSSYCPRFNYETTKVPQTTSCFAENNTSVHMKALALKYLSDDQLADLAVQKHGDVSVMRHLKNVHGANISLATMNYLQRYRLSAGMDPYTEGYEQLGTIRQKKLKHMVMTQEFQTQSPVRNHAFNETSAAENPCNILDITSLKQQPKLL